MEILAYFQPRLRFRSSVSPLNTSPPPDTHTHTHHRPFLPSLLLYTSYASAALHNVCHSNYQQLTEAQVINSLVDLCDRDSNGIIKEAEVVVAFAEILEISR